jgi:basic membrane protein A and related proteins
MRGSRKITSVLATAGLLATACGSSSSNSSSTTAAPATSATTAAGGSATTAASSGTPFTACMVTDTGGIDDRSFNASSYQGLKDAATADSAITPSYVQSTTESDYTPNINGLVQKGCGIIVTVGFLMGDATQAAAKANPNQKFAIVDYNYSPALPNVLGLIFNTAQAGFLGGYLAAGMTKTGTVATFGGQKLPTVTIYMDGFADGVAYYNSKHGKSVKVLGWDEASQNGTFTGDFTDQSKGKNVTQTFIQQGADIIFPVAGNVGLGAAAAVQQNGNGVHMEWVDTDGCVSAPQYCSIFLTSVVKGISVAVAKAATDAAKGTFTAGNYVGTLANNGVGISPFHDFASQVPSSLQAEIDQVKQGIISGSIPVATPNAPASS